jgi:hypothetical protein
MGTIISIFVLAFFIQGCTKDTKLENTEFDGTKYLQISDLTDAAADLENYAQSAEVVENPDYALSVPTYITKIDGIWFIVDCYHNRVVYNDNVDESLTGFDIMCSEAVMPHTIAGDGTVYLIDDTENNRVLIYEKSSGKFILTQKFDNIGVRPHFTVYDEATDTFYVWSSESGELYCFRHTKDSSRMYLTEIRKIDELADTYVRSFTIIDGDIYFVSSDEALVFSETLGQFTSFMDYGSVPLMVNIDQSFYAITSEDNTSNVLNLWEMWRGQYNEIFGEFKPFWLTFISNTDPDVDKVFNTLDWRTITYTDLTTNGEQGILAPFTTFDTLRVWHDHQDTGDVSLTIEKDKPSILKKKFNVFRSIIPRDMRGDWSTTGRQRIRNTWTYIKLGRYQENYDYTVFSDLGVNFFE